MNPFSKLFNFYIRGLNTYLSGRDKSISMTFLLVCLTIYAFYYVAIINAKHNIEEWLIRREGNGEE